MSIFPMFFSRVRRLLCIPMIFLLLCGGSACQASPPAGAKTVLTAMLSVESTPPAGRIYAKESGDDSARTDGILTALYGAECLSWFAAEAPLVDGVALYLSTVQHPFEIAVFRCVDSAGTVAAAKRCAERLDVIRRSWRGTDQEGLCQNGVVEVIGNYVILAVTPSPEAALKAAREALR